MKSMALSLTHFVSVIFLGCLGHEDYRFIASVNHAALDGSADTMPANDNCPRPPNLVTGDKGCGNKDAASGLLGADVKTDAIVK